MRDRLVNVLLAVGVCLCVTGVGWSGQTIIYVDVAATGANDGSSWVDAYVHLQDALAAASAVEPPVEVRVGQGAYKPDQGAGITPGDPSAAFELFDGLALRGGYAGVTSPTPDAWDPHRYATVLSGDLNDDDGADLSNMSDNSDGVVAAHWVDTNFTMEGLTCRAARYAGLSVHLGNSTVRHCRFVANERDGISTTADRLVVNDCVFADNGHDGISCTCTDVVVRDCSFTGQGRRALDSRGAVDLLRCSFTGNAGGVDCFGDLLARSCIFSNNGGWYGAVSVIGDTTLIDCQFLDNSTTLIFGAGAVNVRGDVLAVRRCVFSGNTSAGWWTGALRSSATVTLISNCLFTGNTGTRGAPGALWVRGQVMRVSNCTFADNRGRPNTVELWPSSEGTVEVTQCVVWDGPEPFTPITSDTAEVTMTYNDIQGGYPGLGNISVDPCFVAPGYWADPNDRTVAVAADEPNAVWVTGDYHLKSQAGHWDVAEEKWVFDEVTGPCIDLGDPNGPLGAEPFPNGGYVNLGAYGGTAEASRSYFGEPVCETQIAGDINGDCQVDDLDRDIMLSHWLMPDIGRANAPPTVTIVSPQDGAELSAAEPLVFRFEAFDSDGRVAGVNYLLTHDHGTGLHWSGGSTQPTQDGWVRQHDWSRVRYDGVHVLWAEVLDDDGAKGVAEITITLHP